MFAANRTDIAGILFQAAGQAVYTSGWGSSMVGAAAGQYVRGADKVRQYILGIVETMPKVYLLSAYTEEMMRTWHLGTIYGYDGERMKLPAENIAWQGCSVIAEKQIKKTGKICYYYLQPGKDKATGFHFQIEEESGSLKILDAGNLYGCELYLGGICTFQGEQGNLPAGKEFQPKGYRTGIRFSNPAPGMGGRYMESMESLKARFLDDIYQVHAAVTAEDYEHIVKNVPGLCIDKVRAYRSPKKNAVCIAVKPAHPGMPKLSGKYKQMISQALEEKRMLNTVFELEQPVYLPGPCLWKNLCKRQLCKSGAADRRGHKKGIGLSSFGKKFW